MKKALVPFALLVSLAVACGGATPAPKESAVQLPHVSGGGVVEGPAAPPVGEADATVPIVTDDPTWGSRTAPVTIVEFTDFQCPFCGRAVGTVEQLEHDYGPAQLRVVFKNYPLSFHPYARPTADAAATVHALGGDDAFWSFYHQAFSHQQALDEPSLEAYAQRAGVSLAAFRSALRAKQFSSKVDADLDLGKRLGVDGTPAFFINGTRLVGAQPIEEFHKTVDAELAKAKAELAKGVAPAALYKTVVAENYKPAAEEDDEPHADTTTVWRVPVDAKAPVRGAATALVTIVEFGDFQCPYCKRADATIKALRAAYGNDLRVVWRNEPLPFHKRAEPAAELALEARAEKGDAGFWAAHDKLFDTSPKLEDADLDAIATALKLNLAKVHAAIAKHKYQKVIDDDVDIADDFQASGTPHFFINGRRLVGAQPIEKFKAIIDEELPKARALVAAGTKPEDVYAGLTKDGKTPPPPEKNAVAFTGKAPTRGAIHAPVKIVELADFQCPFCKRAEDTVKQVLKGYPGKVKVEWRQMPLRMHSQAHLAAEAAAEAFAQKGNTGFWKLHDLMYEHQTDPDGLSRASIEGYARTAGLDVKRLHLALETGKHVAAIDAEEKLATDAGITGTPTFLINGYVLSGAQPYAKFRKLIDRALAEAKAAKGKHP